MGRRNIPISGPNCSKKIIPFGAAHSRLALMQSKKTREAAVQFSLIEAQREKRKSKTEKAVLKGHKGCFRRVPIRRWKIGN